MFIATLSTAYFGVQEICSQSKQFFKSSRQKENGLEFVIRLAVAIEDNSFHVKDNFYNALKLFISMDLF